MGESPIIKVLIVDDHNVVREGLRRILELDNEIEVVGEARNGEEAVTRALSLSPDVITMDLKMPGIDGIAATRQIKQRLPAVNILVLTLYAEEFVRQAIEAGASGYLLKDCECQQIIEAIHQVHAGFSPIAPSLTRGLVTEFARLGQNSRSSLNRRQIEILELIAGGVSGKEIGSRLFISASTVKREIRHIFDKLGVNDRSHAVSQAMKRKII